VVGPGLNTAALHIRILISRKEGGQQKVFGRSRTMGKKKKSLPGAKGGLSALDETPEGEGQGGKDAKKGRAQGKAPRELGGVQTERSGG